MIVRTSIAVLLLAATSALAQTDTLRTGLHGGWALANGDQIAPLRMQMAPGWHTYWRAPGDAGIPPQFDWSGSENVASVRIRWPRPQVFSLGGSTTIGYEGDLTLPLEIAPRDASKPMFLRGRGDVGVCNEICVPASFEVSADLPRPSVEDPTIAAALRRRPSTGAEAGLAGIACTLSPTPDGLRLSATLTLPDTGGREVVVVEAGDPTLYVSPADVVRSGGRLTAVVDVSGSDGGPVALVRDRIVLSVLGSKRAVEISGCPAG